MRFVVVDRPTAVDAPGGQCAQIELGWFMVIRSDGGVLGSCLFLVSPRACVRACKE